MEPRYEPAGRRGALAAHLGGGGPLQRRGGRSARAVRGLHPAAERDRRAAHGPRAQRLARRTCFPLAPDARASTRSCSRATTTRASRLQAVVERSSRRRARRARTSGARRSCQRCWDLHRHYGGQIMGQLRSMGASLDYRRERFTMDDDYVARGDALLRPPLRQGLDLPRATASSTGAPGVTSTRSPTSRSTTSTSTTRSTWIRYPLAEGDGHVTIATVRPATMLADVAVAVHPDDERYRDLVGKEAIVPDRRAARADHRRRARRAGLRHRRAEDHARPRPDGLGDRARPRARRADGDRARRPDERERRRARGADAGRGRERGSSPSSQERGLLEKREPYRHSVGHCDRSGDRIEPLVLLQWWVRDEGARASPRSRPLRDGRVRSQPEQQTKVMLSYLENIRPWCISRQLWWGHRIPVWYCPDGHTTVARERAGGVRASAGSTELTQEEDVLDTWFSSALWPFATLGWPEQTPGPRDASTRATSARPAGTSTSSGSRG